jgi:hypothetical protein
MHPDITIIGAFTLIQISPIKINPWSWVAGLVHKFLFGKIDEKLDKISANVDRLEKQVEEDKARQARTHILRFADELYEKKHHTQEYFLQILDDAKFYEEYVASHKDFANGRTENACKIIRETYDSLWKEHKF